MNSTNNALIFKAMGDETRLKILELLKGGELCGCKLLESFNITQPTLSYHMKILCESKIVRCRRDGAWMRYSLNFQTLKDIEVFLSEILLQGKKL